MKLLGAVLAGGGSRRFGSPKALARLHGRPLWRLACDRLEAVCDRVVVVANDPRVARAVEEDGQDREEDGQDGMGPRSGPQAGSGRAGAAAAKPPGRRRSVADDLRPGLGPLAGIETALALAAHRGMDAALVLAVDMPWVDGGVLSRLAEAWRAGGGARAAVPRVGPGTPEEPLCAVYPVSALAAAAAALDEGRRTAAAFARGIGAEAVGAGAPAEAFASVNEPCDLPPPAISVVGNKNSGKTTLAVRIVAELRRRGRRVMSAKHGHNFRLDTPGTDSWRHRHEGQAERVLLAGPAEFALLGDWSGGAEPSLDALLLRHLQEAEIVVAEGFRAAAAPKVEVYRASAQSEAVFGPMRARSAGVLCAVTDWPEAPWTVPAFAAAAPETASRVTDMVEEALLPSGRGGRGSAPGVAGSETRLRRQS